MQRRVETERRRVLFFSCVGSLGGGERCLLRLLSALAAREWHPLLACPGDSPLAAAAREQNVPVFAVDAPAFFDEDALDDDAVGASGAALSRRRLNTWTNYGRAMRAAARLVGVIRRSRCALVHSNSPRSAAMAGVAARLTRRPAVTHVRDIVHTPFSYPFRRQLLERVTDAYVAASNATAEIIRTARAVTVAYDGLPAELLQPRQAPAAHTGCEIGMAAVLSPWKGHEVFIRAAIDLVAARPELRFSILGGDLGFRRLAEHRERLERLIADAGVTGVIRFQGHREGVAEWMSTLRVFVHPPTHPDPFPGALLEACAVGCPIVATRTGGIPEIVVDGQSALLVPPGDHVALASAVGRLLDDPDLSRRLGKAAREAASAFTMARTAAAVESAYQGVGLGAPMGQNS